MRPQKLNYSHFCDQLPNSQITELASEQARVNERRSIGKATLARNEHVIHWTED